MSMSVNKVQNSSSSKYRTIVNNCPYILEESQLCMIFLCVLSLQVIFTPYYFIFQFSYYSIILTINECDNVYQTMKLHVFCYLYTYHKSLTILNRTYTIVLWSVDIAGKAWHKDIWILLGLPNYFDHLFSSAVQYHRLQKMHGNAISVNWRPVIPYELWDKLVLRLDKICYSTLDRC